MQNVLHKSSAVQHAGHLLFRYELYLFSLRCCLANRLDYFIVGVSNDTKTPPVRGKYLLCGQYPLPAINGEKHYLACQENTPSAQYVIIQQPSNGTGKLTMCEVEIYPRKVTDSKFRPIFLIGYGVLNFRNSFLIDKTRRQFGSLLVLAIEEPAYQLIIML